MSNSHNNSYAPYLTDDGKAVSILMKQDDPESYLLFTNKSMKRFARILVDTLDFDKKHGFRIDWRIEDDYPDKRGYLGYSFKGWGMSQFIPAGNGNFGKVIEHVKMIFSESERFENQIESSPLGVAFVNETVDSEVGLPVQTTVSGTWKHNPNNYHMEKLWGHRIYHNLLNVCKAKIKVSGKEDVFSILKNRVLREVERQTRGNVEVFGETYNIGGKKEVRPCNNPLILAGLCLIWPYEFFNVEDIYSMGEEDLRNPKIAERCGGKDCTFEWQETIWQSKTKVAKEMVAGGGLSRGSITKNICYCGRVQLQALRTEPNYKIMDTSGLKSRDEMSEKEIEDMLDDDGEIIVTTTDDVMPHPTKKNSEGEDNPPIIGPGNEFDYRRFEPEFEPELEPYRHDVLAGLLFSIFNGRRNYSVDEGDPEYRKRDIHIKRELPLPEADIRLLADKIIQSLAETTYYEDCSGQLPKRHYEADVLARRRAAKHRLGRKITEIGQFLQWWGDLPIHELFQKEVGNDWVAEKPLLILEDGIRNVGDYE